MWRFPLYMPAWLCSYKLCEVILEILQVSMNSLIWRENGKVLTCKGGVGGGGGRPGVPGVRTRDTRQGLGGPCTRKKLPRTWVQIHTQHPGYAKKFLTPPPNTPTPNPPKRGTLLQGAKGVKNEKFIA